MKKSALTVVFGLVFLIGFAQVDTISENLYQYNGRIGIGGVNEGGYFNPSLRIFNGWLQVSSFNNFDAGFVISHEHKEGYGFARTLHQVFEGVSGDPYTEFRVRSTFDDYTVTSWAIGAQNQNEDKLIISNDIYTLTGASPSVGYKVAAIRTSGEFGIGTTEPNSRLEVANGDIFISDIECGIIMKSPDGSCWRGTLDINGRLNFIPYDCPGLITSVNTPEPSGDVKIYPNPTGGSITVNIDSPDRRGMLINLIDLNGKILMVRKVNSESVILDISQFPQGTYIVTISGKNGEIVSSSRVVRQ